MAAIGKENEITANVICVGPNEQDIAVWTT